MVAHRGGAALPEHALFLIGRAAGAIGAWRRRQFFGLLMGLIAAACTAALVAIGS